MNDDFDNLITSNAAWFQQFMFALEELTDNGTGQLAGWPVEDFIAHKRYVPCPRRGTHLKITECWVCWSTGLGAMSLPSRCSGEGRDSDGGQQRAPEPQPTRTRRRRGRGYRLRRRHSCISFLFFVFLLYVLASLLTNRLFGGDAPGIVDYLMLGGSVCLTMLGLKAG